MPELNRFDSADEENMLGEQDTEIRFSRVFAKVILEDGESSGSVFVDMSDQLSTLQQRILVSNLLEHLGEKEILKQFNETYNEGEFSVNLATARLVSIEEEGRPLGPQFSEWIASVGLTLDDVMGVKLIAARKLDAALKEEAAIVNTIASLDDIISSMRHAKKQ